ncbi:MAG: DUF6701 domain-containing protein [Pseudomonadota bacterium]
MNRHEMLWRWAKIFLFASIQLGLMFTAPAALAITKANFDKVAAAFQWETASTVISGLACDDCTQQINIGFDFPFAGERFNKIYVSSNGVLSFLGGVNEYTNNDLPTSTANTTTSAFILPYWDDLNPAVGGSITYATLGSAPNRRLVVSWNGVPHFSSGGSYSFQAILYENGEIKFQFGSGNANGASATIGIEVANDDFNKNSYNSASISPGSTALLFRPQPYVQSVTQPCGSANSMLVRYSYPMDPASAGRKQNYDFSLSPTSGLNVISASLSPDGYTVTLTLNKSLQANSAYQLRIKDVLSVAGRAINPNPTTRPISGASGILGTYYSQYGIQRAYHTGPWIQRNDAQVDFSWDTAVPDILPRGDDFSIRWEGYLIPSRSGSHIFRTYSDDGIRLWVNGTKILDAWNDHAARYDDSSAVSLNAGEAVPIVLEHYERGGRAYARLYWDEPDGTSGNFTLIPSSALSPCPLTPSGPDHIRIEHDGQGLTCLAEDMTLRACADAACTNEYTGDVTVNLAATNGGALSPNPITFNGHAVVQLSKTTVGETTLSVASASPSPVNPWDCVVNGALVSQSDCKVNFADAGFVFDVPNVTACETSSSVTLRAVKKSDSSTSCAPAFTGNRTVHFWSTYINPASGSQALSINGTTVAGASPGTPISLNFNSSGEATFTASYTDVGLMQLDVRYDGSAATNDAGLVMTGSDQFVARPHHFDLASIRCADGTNNPGASNANGEKFCKAGEDFKLKVKSVCADGSVTPNFGRESPAESVKLTRALVAPATGSSGHLSGSFAAFGTNCAGNPALGIACGTFQWNEVGIISLTPSIQDGDYLGTGDVSGAASGNIGRFYPHHFELTNASLTPACGPFSYMAQPFGLSFSLTATALGGGTTRNYSGDFAKLDPTQASLWPASTLGQTGFALGAKNGTNELSARLALASNPTGSWDDQGKADIDAVLAFARSGSPDGPFDVLDLGVAPQDSDGVRLEASALDMDADGNGANERKRLGQTIVRFGRMMAERRHQFLETEPITLPLKAQYWDGSTFKTHDLDSCTTLNTAQLRLSNNEESDQHDGSILVGGHTVTLSGAGTLNDGVLNLNLSAPEQGHSGFVDITPELGAAAYPWLRYDWDGDGDHDDDPKGRASWGMYRGNKNVIYLRERWN